MILGAAVCWGLSATAAKALINQHVGTLLIVQTRVTFSCVMLLVLYLAFKPEYLRVAVKDLYHFALLGMIGVAGSNFTYYFTIKDASSRRLYRGRSQISLDPLALHGPGRVAAGSRSSRCKTSRARSRRPSGAVGTTPSPVRDSRRCCRSRCRCASPAS